MMSIIQNIIYYIIHIIYYMNNINLWIKENIYACYYSGLIRYELIYDKYIQSSDAYKKYIIKKNN